MSLCILFPDQEDPNSCDTFFHNCFGKIRSNVREQIDNSETTSVRTRDVGRRRQNNRQQSLGGPRKTGRQRRLPAETSGVLCPVVLGQHM